MSKRVGFRVKTTPFSISLVTFTSVMDQRNLVPLLPTQSHMILFSIVGRTERECLQQKQLSWVCHLPNQAAMVVIGVLVTLLKECRDVKAM